MMSQLENEVRQEIENVHQFFVHWFNGTADSGDLDQLFVPRLGDHMRLISPDGNRLERDALIAMFRQVYGANPEFRIQIREVEILRDNGEDLLVNYTEWQTGARASAHAENARVSTVLLTKAQPFKWLHVHETWLPESVRAAGPFDF